ncbi:MAG: S49 family peptidase [Myxococcales bacterium]|nr:S49 family peptidase [Myxococcales bacterium]
MPTSFPLSPRLVATPIWAAHALRRAFWERGAPLLEVRVGPRSPLPPPHELRALTEGSDIRGVWLKVERLVLRGGQAALHESVDALAACRDSGHLVLAEFDHVGNAEMLLAAACTRAWVRPGSQVFCVGLGTTMRFYGALLARFGAGFDVEAVGEFKSFGEQFSRGFASAPNRESMRALVEDLSEEWVSSQVRHRPSLSAASVVAAVADAPLSAADAVERGFFSGALYPDQVEADIEALVGKEPRVVPFATWAHAARRERVLSSFVAGDVGVPVVWLSGPVMDGRGAPGPEMIAVVPVVEALDQLREDARARAVVLRITSPGGSAPASDLIWRAVERLAAEKPVVASFGDVSASGGVYLSAAATAIWCHPASVTGSIGVIAGKPVLRGAMARQGIHSEDLLTGPQADLFAETAFSPAGRAHLRAGLELTYRAFVERVAKGRKRTYEEIEPHARGRVWSGRRAHALGLVDHLGGLGDAQRGAAGLVGATRWRSWDVKPLPSGGFLQRLARRFAFAAVPELALLPEVPTAARLFAEHPAQPLALLPFEFEVG